MQRTLYTSSNSQLLDRLTSSQTHQGITPNRPARRALKMPTQTLEELAQSCLQGSSQRVAPAWVVLRLLRRVVAEILDPRDLQGTVRSLRPAIQSLLQWGLDLEALKTVDSLRLQPLIQVTQCYRELLRHQGLLDPAELLWKAVAAKPPQKKLLIYGYFQPRPDELALMNAIAGDGSIFILPHVAQPLFAETQRSITWLQSQGWEINTPEATSHPLQAAFLNPHASGHALHRYPHLEAEIRGVLAQIKQHLVAGVAPQQIAVVARDESLYGPILLDVAWEYQIPLRVLYGTSLAETRLGEWITQLLTVISEEFPFEETAKLLRHPLCYALDDTQWAAARETHPQNLFAWQGLGINLSLLDWRKRTTRADWVSQLQDVFNRFQLRQRSAKWAREIFAYNTFSQALIDLAKPESETIDFNQFQAEVLDTINLLQVPLQPGRGGVEFHTPRSLMGGNFRYVFILGMAEGILPTPIQDDPVIDFWQRKQLQKLGFPIPSAAEMAKQEALDFYFLLGIASESIHFSYPEQVENSPTLPSSYISQLGLDVTSPPAIPIASLEEYRRVFLRYTPTIFDPVFQAASQALNIELSRESSNPPDEFDGVIQIPLNPEAFTWSSSQLTALGQCAFKWFSWKLLKLTELKEAAADLEPSLRGSLYHKSLELALKSLLNVKDLPALKLENLKPAFEQAERDLNLTTLPAWKTRREEHFQVLNSALQQEEFWQAGTEIIALEQELIGEWQGLTVQGRIDRIDRALQGIILLDYKTSETSIMGVKDAQGKATIDLQLPIYQQLAQQHLSPEETVVNVHYFALRQGKLVKQKQNLSSAEMEAIAQGLKSHLETGSYPVHPDVEQKACRYCSFDLVCRKGARLSRKFQDNNPNSGNS